MLVIFPPCWRARVLFPESPAILFKICFGPLARFQQAHLPLSLAGFCSALPFVAISHVPAVVYQSQIASSIVQAVAVYMVTFFTLSELPAQNAF